MTASLAVDTARRPDTSKEKLSDKASAPQELQGDEDDGDEDAGNEETCRRSLEDAIGAVMKAAPQEFQQCLPECTRRITQWLGTKEHLGAVRLVDQEGGSERVARHPEAGSLATCPESASRRLALDEHG